jgi:hypothetical protein
VNTQEPRRFVASPLSLLVLALGWVIMSVGYPISEGGRTVSTLLALNLNPSPRLDFAVALRWCRHYAYSALLGVCSDAVSALVAGGG